MPTPGEKETEKEFISRCIPIVLDEGTAKDEKQAAAICYSIWKEKKSLDPDEELIYFGGEVKDLGDGKIGGYAFVFSKAQDPDLTHDFFDKAKSRIEGPLVGMPMFYLHGRDSKMGDRVIGRITKVAVDDIGGWTEAQLNLRDEYEKAVLSMAKAGKLGYSTGALSHLANREPVGNGVNVIKTWVIGEVSLTPTPAEPRLVVTPLKSLFPSEKAALPIQEDEHNPIKETKSMSDTPDIKAEVAAALKAEMDARDAAAKAEAEKTAALKTAEEAGYKKAVEELKSKRLLKSAPAYVKNAGDDNDGVMAFKSWLITGDVNDGLIRPDESWMKGSDKTFSSQTGPTGAFLMPDPLYAGVIAKRDLMSWVRQAPCAVFQTSSDHILVPIEATKATNFVRTSDGGTYDQNEPTVNQVDIMLYKYTKEIRTSEEFVSFQNTNFDTWIADVIARSVGTTENTIYTVGSGGNEPQGILTGATAGTTAGSSLTAVAALDLTYLVGLMPAGYNVPSQCGFMMRNVTKWIAKSLASLAFPFMSEATTPDFLGYKCYISDDLPLLGTASALGALMFANFNMYGVAEKPGITVQRNPYLRMNTGEVSLFCNIFRGGAVLQAEAIYAGLNHA